MGSGGLNKSTKRAQHICEFALVFFIQSDGVGRFARWTEQLLHMLETISCHVALKNNKKDRKQCTQIHESQQEVNY